FHFVTIGALVFIITLPISKRLLSVLFSKPDIIVIIAAALFSSCAAIAYARSKRLQNLLTFASPAIIVIPVIFLFFSPVRGVISTARDGAIESPKAGDFKTKTPVVMVIFDEFPLLSLLDKNGEIDKKLFPNIYKLSKQAHWFRNATTVSAATNYATPAILSGKRPDEKKRLPKITDYPGNLFTLLERGYDFNVVECCSQLSPKGRKTDSSGGFKILLKDLYIIYLHILAPPGLAEGLPPVDLMWEGFASEAPADNTDNEAAARRLGQFPEFIESISKRSSGKESARSLDFIHTVFPHSPWVFYPSGRTYGGFGSGPRGITGLDKDQWWTLDEWPVIQAYQRHLLQVVYADKLVGRLVKKLKDEGLYDDSLIVLVADHGISFTPGDHMRSLTETNFAEILKVPLFIKEPYQNSGEINDTNAETVDILPTIADILGINIAWKTDGSSLIDPARIERPKKIAFNGPWVEGEFNKRYEYAPDLGDWRAGLKRKFAIFGDGMEALYGPGRDRKTGELIGRSIDEIPDGGVSRLRIDIALDDLKTETGPSDRHLDFGLLAGRVINIKTAEGRKIRLALSMDKTITATTMTLAPEDGSAGFSFLIPEVAFTDKRKTLEIFEVSGTGKALSLKAIIDSTYMLMTDAGREVIALFGESGEIDRRIKVDHSAMLGRLEKIGIREGGGQLFLNGWAADTLKKKKAKELLIFVKGKYLSSATTKYKNPGEALLRGAPEMSGFNFAIPVQTINRPGTSIADIRIFAVSKDGRATELNYLHGFHGVPDLKIEKTPSDGERIVSGSGASFQIMNSKDGGLKGALTAKKDFGDQVIFSGWAIDTLGKSYPDSILLFSEGRLINLARTSYYMPELVKETGFKGALKSGFIFEMPAKVMKNAKGLRLFALSKDGRVVELEYPEGF
ncbi:MAG: sulfatase-like hydrolase/transferase, partial [Thermodesulfobacteriota bacterium]